MSLFKSIIIVLLISFLNASCATSGGLKECEGTALLLGGIGAAIGVATGKNAEDRIKRGLKGGAIGVALGGITCLLNRKDQGKIEYGLNNAPPEGGTIGSCLNEDEIKTRGFGVKPDDCPEKGPLNIIVGQKKVIGDKVCRQYSTEVFVDGAPRTEISTACQGPDGKWQDMG